MPSLKLRPDKSLLCPDFDGYKLSSGSGHVQIYTKAISDGLCKSNVKGASYLQTRLDALHNCLVADAGSPTDGNTDTYSTVYCFNKLGQLLAYDYSTSAKLCQSRVVWQTKLQGVTCVGPRLLLPPHPLAEVAPRGASDDASFGALRPSVALVGPSLAVISDGCSELCVLETEDRSPLAHHTWGTVFTAAVGGCKVVDARLVSGVEQQGRGDDLHVLLVAVATSSQMPVATPAYLSSSPSLHLVTWLVLSHNNDGCWCVRRERCYAGAAALDYCQLNADCSDVVLITSRGYTLVHDSEEEEEGGAKQQEEEQQKEGPPVYRYQQTDDDVTLQVAIGGDVSSDDVRVVVSACDVTLSSRATGQQLFKGTWTHKVDTATATWTVGDGCVEVCVCKDEAGQRWAGLLQEAELRGVEGEAGQDLAPLAAQEWRDETNEEEKPPYNPGQLESCDDVDDDLFLLLLGEDKLTGSRSTNLGNTQYLATIPTGAGLAPLFCLRHDVDGLVWRVGEGGEPQDCFGHIATFHAFGYVKASKTMAKYTSAPPDCSYVAVCDVRSHVYLFCQPQPLDTELRNRRTGRTVGTLARQLLLSLPTHEEVMGLVTLASVLFVCTDKNVYAYAIKLGDC